MNSPILRLALPAPVFGLFDYLPPAGLDPALLQPGQRLMVPFGPSERCGLLVEIGTDSEIPGSRLKAARVLLDEQPLLDKTQMDFLRWAAAYYHHPQGEVLMSALPVRLRKGKALLKPRPDHVFLLQEPDEVADALKKRAPRQYEILCWLRDKGGSARLEDFRRQFPSGRSILNALRLRGCVDLGIGEAVPGVLQTPAHELEPEQQAALDAVTANLDEYGAFLLDGVTGSGKTEVYFHIAEQVLARGRSVLLLVPEISLTPQLVRRVARRLAVRVAVMHSGLSDGEREQAWQLARSGEARMVLGTRSAVFASLPDLGLVLVDEEHDASYKQQEGFRYSARDMALVRASRAACPVVLGSATPSLESLRNAMDGRYGWLRLTRRAGGARAPRMQVLDVRNQRLAAGLSPVVLQALEQTLARGEQALVFLNRRGYAPVLSCYGCGWLSDCPRCDARQTLHLGQGKLICHHCGNERIQPKTCPSCGSSEIHPLGQGTEQLEETLKQRFPEYPLVRIDRDAASRKGTLERLLARVKEGGAGLLVGTQMLAKGHHFPNLTLVVMVDVDSGLFSADFRSAERMAQLIVQVAGRAGRAELPGRVLLQTRFPDHPLLRSLVEEDYNAFARRALKEREMAGLPPCSSQALIRASARSLEIAEGFLEQAAELAGRSADGRVAVWGPVPAPMRKRAGRHRAQLLLQTGQRPELQRLLDLLVPALSSLPDAGRVRWSVDVDPVDLY
ncbi:primosomal protein N' [Thiolapillus brandeum]|uniref:Replication restart protein PriA n=1 Tax=Thiolapillus brandeum TaxID=1076588 RepID=A0A7U6GG37_9GAMM|nr:primosomal protein N' [Thiolapillus brandeum]BAO42994.1 primosomal protein N' [Thiolapillus brandeum]